jgi:glycerol-3-phosphate cytidylyltransferase
MMIGAISGTFDLLHADHIRLLKACKEGCTYLIVMLVTDELGIKQKRIPSFDFEHRRVLLEATKYVDLVVPHNGEPKELAWKKLKFDILFSSDEYLGSEEHKLFEEALPNVRCIYYPKNNSTSTSTLLYNMQKRFLQNNFNVLTLGVNGPIYNIGDCIAKTINVSMIELQNVQDGFPSTRDVFSCFQFNHLPRNWKGITDGPIYPMISGVNSFRELEINKRYENKPWSTYSYTVKCYNPKDHSFVVDLPENVEDLANNMYQARQHPAEIWLLVQKQGGVTLDEYMQQKYLQDVQTVLLRIHEIIEELRGDGVIHGDIHSKNVLVNDKGNVYIIDFGWCCARNFSLCIAEAEWLEGKLKENWDWQHFLTSLSETKLLPSLIEFAHNIVPKSVL